MHLDYIKIKNYRSCLSTEISFGKELTALIGLNGSGKTNILKAISCLSSAVSGRSMRDINDGDTSAETQLEGRLMDGTKTIRFKFDCIQATGGRSAEEIITSQTWDFSDYDKLLKPIQIPINLFQAFDSGAPRDMLRYIENMSRNKLTGTQLELILTHRKKLPIDKLVRFLNDIRYYSASQFADPVKCPASIELEDDRESRRFPTNGSHSQLIHGLYRQHKENSPIFKKFCYLIGPDTLNLISSIDFKEFSIPSNKYEVISAGKYKLIESNRKLIIPEVKIDEKLLSLSQLSEGTFKTMSLLFYLLTDYSGIAIIEEPEVSVHRGLLLSLLEIFKSESIDRQIIISTHSETVLDNMKPDWVRIVKRVSRKGTQASALSKILSVSKYKRLKEYLSETGSLGEYFKEEGIEDV